MPLVVNVCVVSSKFLLRQVLPVMRGYRGWMLSCGTLVPQPTTGIRAKPDEPRTPNIVSVLMTWEIH
eukprot:1506830-Amphidinium_carterae.1